MANRRSFSQQQQMGLSAEGSGGEDVLYTELWNACAGPLVDVPKIGERVYYFPQGHMEQLEASTNEELNQRITMFSLPSKILCRVLIIQLLAEKDTDEVYAQITLMPEADDMSQQTPTQELVAKDLLGTEWPFKHIFRENGELRVGVRRHTHYQSSMPSSVISSQSMHLGVLATASHAVSTTTLFVVYYKPRTSQFIIGLNKYLEAVNHGFEVGSRFKMRFEGEDSPERRFSGTIIGIEDFSPHWEDSIWRSLKVQWDEPASIRRPERVSPWEIEPFVASVPTNLVQSLATKYKRSRSRVEIPVPETQTSTASAVWNPSHDSHEVNHALEEQRSVHIKNCGNSNENASQNVFAEETEKSKSASAWSAFSNHLATHSGKQSNVPVPYLNDRRESHNVATCRLFGVDLISPSIGVLGETSKIKPVNIPSDACERYNSSKLSSVDSEQKSCLSKDSKESKQEQLQVLTKEVQRRENQTSRSCTKAQMQGVPLCFAVDLTALKGYGELISELEEMFGIKGGAVATKKMGNYL
ncbi:Auxin response factor 9 [Abeliophyllum distichum]|uniref:Auxin-responsive protein n=1 Tax=Abeliophyllum distichum TaxID=126358 RepID=A0ABD1TVD6_9LAMI